ncbi:hypothetical protein C8F04DRAFT_936264 [Mycena alexandri]|uniref:Glycerophosphocholine acyltransferase 1 n=1 Tax=Mycena alexandri TaxID=1745969 RepID=A0AAD6TJF9_9AGAR|nr:hypothetical protein C8F04DRAFT_936264 [Mycena alexandri]
MPSPSSPPNGRTPFSASFERFKRDEMAEWAGAFTLLDTVETYFDSHVDLLQRKLQKHSDRLKMRAEETFKIRDLSGDLLAENFEREFKGFKLKIQSRMTSLASSWQSAKVVRTREKLSFFFGVMSMLFSALIFGLAPQWVHISYTVQGLYLLPLRAYTYKKRAWHYFLFDLCYYVTILNFVYIWFLPSSPALFVACYCLSHGSLASAVITWRNSLVFHDQDKVTSLFVHIYAPFTFTVIRHFYPSAEIRFPALRELQHLNPLNALLLSGGIYLIWQLLYWKFVLVDRRAKIESGQRTTSFSFLLNDKRGVIGRSLSSVPAAYREAAFMFGQLLYGVLTEVPAVYLLYNSPRWSGVFLILILAVSVWNGGGFYIEVFGRKFERELEALRKELADTIARTSSGRSSPLSTPGLSQGSEDEISSSENSPPIMNSKLLPEDPPAFNLQDVPPPKKDQ